MEAQMFRGEKGMWEYTGSKKGVRGCVPIPPLLKSQSSILPLRAHPYPLTKSHRGLGDMVMGYGEEKTLGLTADGVDG